MEDPDAIGGEPTWCPASRLGHNLHRDDSVPQLSSLLHTCLRAKPEQTEDFRQ